MHERHFIARQSGCANRNENDIEVVLGGWLRHVPDFVGDGWVMHD